MHLHSKPIGGPLGPTALHSHVPRVQPFALSTRTHPGGPPSQHTTHSSTEVRHQHPHPHTNQLRQRPDIIPATVDCVLSLVAGTDGGAQMSKKRRNKTDELLDKLEEVGSLQTPRPLANELLWGNYNVVYTSTQRSREKRSPSGGRFRSSMGRSLFKTTGLYQSVLKPGIVTNKVSFKLLGLIPGAVGLRGKVEPQGTNGDTVRVDFDPPVMSLLENINGGLHLRIGKPSDVTLITTYLDERVRVGKGSRGSLFMFTRGGAADHAGMDKVGIQATAPSTVFSLAATCVASMLGGVALLLGNAPWALKACAPLLMLLGVGLGMLLRGGKIIQGRDLEASAQPAELPKDGAADGPKATVNGGSAQQSL